MRYMLARMCHRGYMRYMLARMCHRGYNYEVHASQDVP